MTAFEEMGVLPEIGKAVEEMEWTLPTDVQSEAVQLILGGGDVLMAAETGSGKTGAFCLPILQIVWETLKDLQTGKGKMGVKGVSIKHKEDHLSNREHTGGGAVHYSGKTGDGILTFLTLAKARFGNNFVFQDENIIT
ncbi:ATP-dependent RNA helicase Ddx1-like [Tachypleus tridentatus]|uniref:ATP-dependent RNA helicase Ddx1-like n=1 Tax=Tachypleus tridentatus TaxID=6853 RepID=UPI003FD1AB5C